MDRSSKLLVAVDSSFYANEILDEVYHHKYEKGTQIHVLTVLNTDSVLDSSEEYMNQCEYILKERVQRMQNRLPNCKVTGDCLAGNPAKIVLEVASRWQAELIVIGSHGDTGIRPDKIGSVAAAIVNSAPCSVMVIKVCGRKCERAHVHSMYYREHSKPDGHEHS